MGRVSTVGANFTPYTDGPKLDSCKQCAMKVEAKAMERVAQYYKAIESHSWEGMLECVSEGVAVTFVDSNRNWAGRAIAKEKFSGWLKSAPKLAVTWSVRDVICEDQDQVTVITLDCDFKPGSKHAMRYYVSRQNEITKIEHLP